MNLALIKKKRPVGLTCLLLGTFLLFGNYFSNKNSFKMNDYTINHHYVKSGIDIEVDLSFKKNSASINTQLVKETINKYLVNYPNEDDFWEILNKNLTTELLTKPIVNSSGSTIKLNEVVDSISIQMDIKAGSSGIEFPRSSLIKGSVHNDQVELQESFSFKINDYKLDRQSDVSVIDIGINLNFKEGIGDKKSLVYPNIKPIEIAINNYLANNPTEESWEILNKNLATKLLSEPLVSSSGNEIKLNELIDSLSIQIDIKPRNLLKQNQFKTTVYSQ